ncbi:MAG: uroporphyrinogen decarboxylase family protein [Planctomycetota bacterium]
MATQLERFQDTVAHRVPDQVLAYANFTPDLKERMVAHCGTEDLAGHFDMYTPRYLGLKRTVDFNPDFSVYYQGETWPESFKIGGNGVASTGTDFYHFRHKISPLRNAGSLDDVVAFPIEDQTTYSDEDLPAEVDEAHRHGLVVSGTIGHLYESAWQLRGYEQFLMDMVSQPEWADSIFERLHQNNLHKARAYARAGVDVLHCGDDVANQNAMMFHPDMWWRFIGRRWAELWAEAKSIHPDIKVWYHSDGNIEAIIPRLIEIGVDILNPVQPECMDINRLHRQFGDKLVFDGTIGTQSVMPWGTPEEVRQCVRERIETLGTGGGLIVSPTHILEPEVPIENIEALFAAAKEFGGRS